MQAVTVVFDDILHVHRNGATRSTPKHTVFSFMSEFKYTPYVTVPGWPRLEPGMSVRALLREPGEWKSLVGWVDLKTGQFTAPSPRWHLHRLLFLCAWLAFLSVLIGRAAVQLQYPQALLWFLIAGFWGIFFRIEYKAWQRAKADHIAVHSLVGANEA